MLNVSDTTRLGGVSIIIYSYIFFASSSNFSKLPLLRSCAGFGAMAPPIKISQSILTIGFLSVFFQSN